MPWHSSEQDEDAILDDDAYQQIRQRVRQSCFSRKHAKLHSLLAEVVQDFGLLSFMPLDISKAESVGRVLAKIDKCNGYVFVAGQEQQQDLFNCAIQTDSPFETIADIQERLASFTRQATRRRRIIPSNHTKYIFLQQNGPTLAQITSIPFHSNFVPARQYSPLEYHHRLLVVCDTILGRAFSPFESHSWVHGHEVYFGELCYW